MPSGKLGSSLIPSGGDVTVYTVPANTITTANIMIGADIGVTTKYQLKIGSHVVHNASVAALSLTEYTAIVMSAGEAILISSIAGNINVRVHGFEEAI